MLTITHSILIFKKYFVQHDKKFKQEDVLESLFFTQILRVPGPPLRHNHHSLYIH